MEDPQQSQENQPIRTGEQVSANKKIPALIGVGALLLLVGLGAILIGYQQPQTEGGLYERSLSVGTTEELKALAENAKNLRQTTDSPEEKARLTIFESFLRLNFDRPASNELLRTLAADTVYSNTLRALAVQMLADFYMIHRRNIADAEDIFVGEPYKNFPEVSAEGTPLYYKAIRKVYEYSTSINSLPVSEYRIAEWYLSILETADLTPENRTELLSIAEKRYARGNTALPAFAEWVGTSPLFGQTLGYAKWLQAAVLGRIALARSDGAMLTEAETKFKNIITELTAHGDNLYWDAQSAWANLEYALFLQRAYGAKRASDISETLGKILTAPQAVGAYLNNLQFANGKNPFAQADALEVKALAAYDTAFAQYLRSIGWKI